MLRFLIYLCLSSILCFSLCSLTPSNDGDFIIWSSQKKLTWADFRGPVKANRNGREQSATKTIIQIQTSIFDNTVNCEVQCKFLTCESWASENLSEKLLAHEQLHFDISELFARKLRKKIKEMNFDNRNEIKANIQQIYSSTNKECIQWQLTYDEETAHSNNRTRQQKWEEKISKQIELLSDYSEPRLEIRL